MPGRSPKLDSGGPGESGRHGAPGVARVAGEGVWRAAERCPACPPQLRDYFPVLPPVLVVTGVAVFQFGASVTLPDGVTNTSVILPSRSSSAA